MDPCGTTETISQASDNLLSHFSDKGNGILKLYGFVCNSFFLLLLIVAVNILVYLASLSRYLDEIYSDDSS